MGKSTCKVVKDDDLYYKAVGTVHNAIVAYIKDWGVPVPTVPIEGVTKTHMYVTSAHMAPGTLWVSSTVEGKGDILTLEFGEEIFRIMNASEVAMYYVYHKGVRPKSPGFMRNITLVMLRKAAVHEFGGEGPKMWLYDTTHRLRYGWKLWNTIIRDSKLTAQSVRNQAAYYKDQGRMPGFSCLH